MKHKSTKSALLMSFVSLLVCFAMLVGSTFAWFTDTATANVNKIQSGSLDVDMVDENGASLTGKTLKFKKAEGHADEAVLWEPGCTYELEGFKIVNNGNLALKFSIELSGITGNAKLNEAIEWTAKIGSEAMALTGANGKLEPAGSSGLIVITGHMDEEAGNEYQGLSIDGISVTVFATQLASEYDSFTNQYDIDTAWTGATGVVPAANEEDGKIHITNAEQLAALAAAVNNGTTYSGQTIVLDKDIDLNNVPWTPAGNVASYPSDTFAGTFDGQNHTILNLNTKDLTPDYASAGLFGSITGTVKNVTLKNVKVVSSHYAGAIVGYTSANACTIENCTVDGGTVTTAPELVGDEYDNGDKAGGIIGYIVGGDTVKGCTVKNLTVKGYRDIGGIVGYANSGSTVTGNTVKDTFVVNDQTINYKDYTTDAEFDAHEIIGHVEGSITESGNTKTNVTIKKIAVVKPAAGQTEQEAFLSAVNGTAQADLSLPEGEYDLNQVSFANGADLTISGTKDTVIKVTKNSGYINSNSADITFDGVTVCGVMNGSVSGDKGIAHAHTVTYKNCTIKGSMRLYGEEVIFENCKFEQNFYEYPIYTYGAKIATFTNCTFNTVGKALKAYTDGGQGMVVNVSGCTFTSDGTGKNGNPDKPAIACNTDHSGTITVNITNCTQTGFITSGDADMTYVKNYEGLVGYETIHSDFVTINIDGQCVHPEN